jgi:hypothetical protein
MADTNATPGKPFEQFWVNYWRRHHGHVRSPLVMQTFRDVFYAGAVSALVALRDVDSEETGQAIITEIGEYQERSDVEEK